MKAINTNSSLRRFQIVGFLSVLLMVGVVGGWANFTHLNGAVIAPATIMVETYSKKVQHKEGGIVGEIRVKDGDRVEIGQALVVLDNTETKSELAIIDGLLDEALAKRARLEAQRDLSSVIVFPAEILARANEPGVAAIMAGQTKLFNARLQAIAGKKEQLNQQIGQLTEQIGGLESQRVSKEKQLTLISAELTDLKDLQTKGLVPVSRVMAMDRETARLDGERGELVASKASAEARIAEVRVQILQIDEEDLSQTLTELREIEGKVAELKERKLAVASRLERMVIKSPITGDVYQLAVHTVGGVIGPGEPLMLIVPEADELILQAQVMPQDIDKVRTGQIAHIRFPAFNSRLTPEVAAEVTQISADTSRIDASSPPFYSVRLMISATELAKLGDNKLKPGMPAEAFIQTEAQTPMTYFLKPLTDQFAHALREE
ncbi:MAG: HlyD family type I secretion periplasmic adaptor subunit [Hyphomicrobiales bacterium]|jgi:HlyD family secretion protein|nr:HlyD family type I secretion periplasmic adaptor subunit [Hyphomicrobiales bacterium]MBP9174268.1 HlyD family type I secretion periplasmic adaptor subunit [Hyphomicrobiales bacterium]MCC7480209.1 HlyD family type I secretion periplasmic adaptor subunit [Hyphomicrobiales bacterium]HRA94119.1 HlyD family type I secretion periplasmic adaptor subunit [Aestuariivirga sp.]